MSTLSTDHQHAEPQAGTRWQLDPAADHRRLGMTWSPGGTLRTPSTLHVKARLREVRP
jgi:hypothetical protein